MRNSTHQGRRLAARVVAWQAAATVAVAAGWLAAGRREAMAALLGGGLVVLGSGLFALRFFGQRQPDAGVVLARLVAATAIKWFVVIGGLALVLGRFGMPALPVLTALAVALMANLAGLRSSD